jgi:hypothetical protein
LASLLGIAVAVLLGTPAPATAGHHPKWFMKDTFDNVGDEPQAAGWWGIDSSYKSLIISCHGLTPGADYFVVNGAWEVIGGFIAEANGKGELRAWDYPSIGPGILIYRSEATGPVLVLEWP